MVGIGGFVGYKLTNRSADFAVGTCVLKDDTSAKVVDCSTGGAYKITSLEDAVSKCPDIFQPSLALPSAPAEHRYACLAPSAVPAAIFRLANRLADCPLRSAGVIRSRTVVPTTTLRMLRSACPRVRPHDGFSSAPCCPRSGAA